MAGNGGVFTLQREGSTYCDTTGGGAISGQIEIGEGGSSITETRIVRDRSGVASRGMGRSIQYALAADGSLPIVCDWDNMVRVLYGIMGGKEDDLTTVTLYDHFLWPTDTLPTYQCKLYKHDGNETIDGLMFTGLSFSAEDNGELIVSAETMGSFITLTNATVTPSLSDNNPVLLSQLKTLTIGGVAIPGQVFSFNAEISRPHVAHWYPSGTAADSSARGLPRIVGDPMTASVSIGMYWSDEFYDWSAGTGFLANLQAHTGSLEATIEFENSATADVNQRQWRWHFPDIKITGEWPTQSQRGDIEVTVSFSGHDGVSEAADLGTIDDGAWGAGATQAPVTWRLSNAEDNTY